MKVVRGKDVVELDESQVVAMLAGYEHLVVDVGTGEGRFAYRYAREHPEMYVLGMDVARDNLREMSARAGRKPARGGLPNVTFVWASAEQPPRELAGRADQVHVILPWGRLLDGLALGDPDTLDGLVALCAPGATVEITLGSEVGSDNVPIKVRHLPELNAEYATGVLAGRYAARGLVVAEARMLTPEEIRQIRSPWARRLHRGRDRPQFLYLRGVTEPAARRT